MFDPYQVIFIRKLHKKCIPLIRYVLVRILIIPLKPLIILFNLICENLTHGYIFNLSKILQMLRFMSFFQRMYSDHFKDLGHKGLITDATNVINTNDFISFLVFFVS